MRCPALPALTLPPSMPPIHFSNRRHVIWLTSCCPCWPLTQLSEQQQQTPCSTPGWSGPVSSSRTRQPQQQQTPAAVSAGHGMAQRRQPGVRVAASTASTRGPRQASAAATPTAGVGVGVEAGAAAEMQTSEQGRCAGGYRLVGGVLTGRGSSPWAGACSSNEPGCSLTAWLQIPLGFNRACLLCVTTRSSRQAVNT